MSAKSPRGLSRMLCFTNWVTLLSPPSPPPIPRTITATTPPATPPAPAPIRRNSSAPRRPSPPATLPAPGSGPRTLESHQLVLPLRFSHLRCSSSCRDGSPQLRTVASCASILLERVAPHGAPAPLQMERRARQIHFTSRLVS